MRDRVTHRLIPFLLLLHIVAFLDRVNVSFAALQMKADLGFGDAVYGFGAGIFFLGYFAFEVPSNLILARVGPRFWIARIMISWGLVSSAMVFVRGEAGFYALRFLTDRPEDARCLSAEECGRLAAQLAAERAEVESRHGADLRRALTHPRVWSLSLLYFALINSIGNLGGFTGPFAPGLPRQATGDFRAGLALLALSLFAAAILALRLPDEVYRRGGESHRAADDAHHGG